MNRVYIWNNCTNVIMLGVMLIQADLAIVVNVDDDALDNMYFDTPASKEQLIAAAKNAFSDINITLMIGKETIFDNYVCEDCGSKDENNHTSRCAISYQTNHTVCYCHADEI